jgi:putative Mg2+ transporter-C (MgtC) family protein
MAGMPDVATQLDFAARLLVVAALGALVGAEREIHGHPAGIRTHMLVALGSAIFTVMSIHGFGQDADPTRVDPTRIAAQIVSGIGFLGAGAILKDGVVIRGLTTAASLWATSAIGMAAGAGEDILGTVAAATVLISLWPINALAQRLHGTVIPAVQLRLSMTRLEQLGEVTGILVAQRLEIGQISTQRLDKDTYRADITIRGRTPSVISNAISAVDDLPGVDVISSSTAD